MKRVINIPLRRYLKWVSFLVVLSLLIILSVIFIPPLIDPVAGFMQRKGNLVKSVVQRQWTMQGEHYTDVMLQSDSGLRVELTWRAPVERDVKKPAVLLVGGYRTGRRAAELIDNTRGVIAASISYPDYARQLKDAGIYSKTRAVQKTILDTIPSILLAMDYLVVQPEIDSKQIEIAGVSLGSFMVAIPAVLDQRFSRVWLVHGGGDPESIFEYQLKDSIESDWLRSIVARIVAYLSYSDYLKPERWVADISPRSVIVINASSDRFFPEESVSILHDSLVQPAEVIWLGKQHVQASKKDIVQQIADLVCDRIQRTSEAH